VGQRGGTVQDRRRIHDWPHAGNASQFKMAGTGSKQEDQIITVALERKSARR
jgi:hypothetical protein